MPPGHFRLEGKLIETLQRHALNQDKRILGNHGATTLAISPAVAELLQGPSGEPVQGAVECTLDANCQLALGERNLSLVDVRLKVEPTATPELATTHP